MARKKNKMKFAFISLTSCEGCYFELLGLREKFLELAQIIEIVEFRLFEDDHYFTCQKLDVAFVEGSPLTKENISRLKTVRENSKIIVACGSCAHIGGIYHLKNYYDKERLMSTIYENPRGLDNLKVKPIKDYVKVDYNLPQCPVDQDEILRFIYSLVINKDPQVLQNPVCYECAINGYECLLKKGEICLGPITQGGCKAICLKSKQPCWGCRGLLKQPQIDNWFKQLKQKRGYTRKQINKILEVFGIKSQIENIKNK